METIRSRDRIGEWIVQVVIPCAGTSVVAAIALGHTPQPAFLTRLARGPLFIKDSFGKAMKVGLISSTALGGLSVLMASCASSPVEKPEEDSSLLKKMYKNGPPSLTLWASVAITAVGVKAAQFGIGLCAQGLMARVRFLHRWTSLFTGFTAGFVLPILVWQPALIYMNHRNQQHT